MGVWGAGLYSSDFAMDLRAVIAAVVRLPFDGDRLLELLRGLEASAANHPDNEDHATFWLVVADQFAKRGIICTQAQETARRIIDEGSDIAMLAKLGMGSADLKKRQKMLLAVRHAVTTAAPPARPRSVLRNPQPLVMGVGDVFVYPTSRGRCREFCPSGVRAAPAWVQDGWNATIIVSAARAFDFLAWYRPLTLASALSEKPDLFRLQSTPSWVLKSPGTCKALDLKRWGMEKIATVRMDSEKLKSAFPTLPSGENAAINNRTIDLSIRGSRLGVTFISERALQKSPDGLKKLPDLIKEATERYERMHASTEQVGRLGGGEEPGLSRLDDILS